MSICANLPGLGHRCLGGVMDQLHGDGLGVGGAGVAIMVAVAAFAAFLILRRPA